MGPYEGWHNFPWTFEATDFVTMLRLARKGRDEGAKFDRDLIVQPLCPEYGDVFAVYIAVVGTPPHGEVYYTLRRGAKAVLLNVYGTRTLGEIQTEAVRRFLNRYFLVGSSLKVPGNCRILARDREHLRDGKPIVADPLQTLQGGV